jgi:hypothetical protein
MVRLLTQGRGCVVVTGRCRALCGPGVGRDVGSGVGPDPRQVACRCGRYRLHPAVLAVPGRSGRFRQRGREGCGVGLAAPLLPGRGIGAAVRRVTHRQPRFGCTGRSLRRGRQRGQPRGGQWQSCRRRGGRGAGLAGRIPRRPTRATRRRQAGGRLRGCLVRRCIAEGTGPSARHGTWPDGFARFRPAGCRPPGFGRAGFGRAGCRPPGFGRAGFGRAGFGPVKSYPGRCGRLLRQVIGGWPQGQINGGRPEGHGTGSCRGWLRFRVWQQPGACRRNLPGGGLGSGGLGGGQRSGAHCSGWGSLRR